MKTLSWRFLAAVATISIVWLMTGKWTVAFSVGGVEALGKLVLYYGHERLWQHLPWGFSKAQEAVSESPKPVISEASSMKT